MFLFPVAAAVVVVVGVDVVTVGVRSVLLLLFAALILLLHFKRKAVKQQNPKHIATTHN